MRCVNKLTSAAMVRHVCVNSSVGGTFSWSTNSLIKGSNMADLSLARAAGAGGSAVSVRVGKSRSSEILGIAWCTEWLAACGDCVLAALAAYAVGAPVGACVRELSMAFTSAQPSSGVYCFNPLKDKNCGSMLMIYSSTPWTCASKTVEYPSTPCRCLTLQWPWCRRREFFANGDDPKSNIGWTAW